MLNLNVRRTFLRKCEILGSIKTRAKNQIILKPGKFFLSLSEVVNR